MRKVLKNQKRVSAIVALALAGMVTFMAALSSYGGPANETEIAFNFDETALMERAIADLNMEEFAIEEEELQTIKIYNAEDELIETVFLTEGESVEDEYTLQLLNQAEYLSEYGNTLIYKVSE